MASRKAYLDYILEQLSDLDNISYRPMMGEYVIYYKGKVIGGIYDDRLLVKPTKSANHLLPNATLEAPYPGAKDMIFVEDVDNRELLAKLLDGMVEELPTLKRR